MAEATKLELVQHHESTKKKGAQAHPLKEEKNKQKEKHRNSKDKEKEKKDQKEKDIRVVLAEDKSKVDDDCDESTPSVKRRKNSTGAAKHRNAETQGHSGDFESCKRDTKVREREKEKESAAGVNGAVGWPSPRFPLSRATEWRRIGA